MKFSYRNHPIFEKLESNSLGTLAYLKDDKKEFKQIVPHLRTSWRKYSHCFLKDVCYVTNTFSKSFKASQETLENDARNQKTNPHIGDSGVFIFADGLIWCYYFLDEKFIFFLLKDNRIDAYLDQTGEAYYYISSVYAKHFKGEQLANTFAHNYFTIMLLKNFQKYCDIEERRINGGQRKKEDKVKYTNDTQTDIKILNVNWFTDSIRTDGFKVKGHLRLQSFGAGLKQKKFIWIDGFQKTGYTIKHKRPDFE